MTGRFPYRVLTSTTLTIGLLAFVLPFASVSCGGQHVLTGSGLNAVAGGRFSVGGPGQHYSGDLSFLLAMVGAVAALACQVFLFRPRARMVACGLGSILSLVMLLVGQVHVNAETSDLASAHVTVHWEVGFWLALLAMGASTLLAALELYSARGAQARSADSSGPIRFRAFLPGGTVPRSVAVTVSGVGAAVAGVMIIAACALPYVHYTDPTAQPATASIFNPGFAPSNLFAAEPVGVALLAFAAGIVLLAWMSRIPRAIAAAVVLAYGAQTFLLFLGYVSLASNSPSAQVGPGGVVGILAGALLFATGVAPARTLFGTGTAQPTGE